MGFLQDRFSSIDEDLPKYSFVLMQRKAGQFRRIGTYTASQLDRMEADAEGLADAYYKVCAIDIPKAEAESKSGGSAVGGVGNATAVFGFCLDVDAASKSDKYPSQSEALEAIRDMPLRPTHIVQTNGPEGGLHVYWDFERPVYLENEDARREVSRILQGWWLLLKERIHLDSHGGIARVLRVPGSKRSDSEYSVQITESSGRKYSLEDFEIEGSEPEEIPERSHEHSVIGDHLEEQGITIADLLIEAGWRTEGCDNYGNPAWWRPGSASGSPSGVEYVNRWGEPGFTVKSNQADPLSDINANGTTGNWYSLPALYLSFKYETDCNRKRPDLWKKTANLIRQSRMVQEVFGDIEDIEDSEPFINLVNKPEESAGEPGFSIRQLKELYPELPEVLIDGICRRQEVVNVIAAPKVGKSFFAAQMGLCVQNGIDFLGFEVPRAAKVFYVDNEVHPASIAERAEDIAERMGLTEDDTFRVWPVKPEADPKKREDLVTILAGLRRYYKPGELGLVVIDALYMLLPPGCSERDEESMLMLYLMMKAFCREMNCTIAIVHHTSKGDQSGKSNTDIGSGTGIMSRAVDTHLTLVPHAEAGKFVLGLSARNFKDQPNITIAKDDVLWIAHRGQKPLTNTKENAAETKLATRKKAFKEFVTDIVVRNADDNFSKNNLFNLFYGAHPELGSFRAASQPEILRDVVNQIPWAYLDEPVGEKTRGWQVGFQLTDDPDGDVYDIMIHHGGYDDDSIF